MLAFTSDQYLILGLAFVLGLFLGMALMASPKWKRRYREEVTRREEAEAENAPSCAANAASSIRCARPPPATRRRRRDERPARAALGTPSCSAACAAASRAIGTR